MDRPYVVNCISVRPYFHSPFLFSELIKGSLAPLTTERSCFPLVVKTSHFNNSVEYINEFFIEKLEVRFPFFTLREYHLVKNKSTCALAYKYLPNHFMMHSTLAEMSGLT